MDIKHLDHLHQTADAPEDVIINAARFYQKIGLPVDQVLDLSHNSILESDKLTTFVYHRSGYSSSRLVRKKERRSSWML